MSVATKLDQLEVKSFSDQLEMKSPSKVQTIKGKWTVRGITVNFTYDATIKNANQIAANVLEKGKRSEIKAHFIKGLILSNSPFTGPNSILTKEKAVVEKYFQTSRVDLFPRGTDGYELIFSGGVLA